MSADTRDLARLMSRIVEKAKQDANRVLDDGFSDLAAGSRSSVPIRTGTLQESIQVFDRSSGDVVRRTYGPTGKAAEYARFVKSNRYGRTKRREKPRAILVTDFRRPLNAARRVMTSAIMAAIVRDIENG